MKPEWSGLISQPFLENGNTKKNPQKLLKSDSFPRLLQGGNPAGSWEHGKVFLNVNCWA